MIVPIFITKKMYHSSSSAPMLTLFAIVAALCHWWNIVIAGILLFIALKMPSGTRKQMWWLFQIIVLIEAMIWLVTVFL